MNIAADLKKREIMGPLVGIDHLVVSLANKKLTMDLRVST